MTDCFSSEQGSCFVSECVRRTLASSWQTTARKFSKTWIPTSVLMESSSAATGSTIRRCFRRRHVHRVGSAGCLRVSSLNSRTVWNQPLRGALLPLLRSDLTDAVWDSIARAAVDSTSIQVEPSQNLTDPAQCDAIVRRCSKCHFFRNPAMSTPASSKYFQELVCKNGEM